MYTLHKSLTMALLAVSIFISGLTFDFVGAQDSAVGMKASRRPVDLILSPYLKFRRLTAEDGLSSDQTWDLAQDKRGFMWFCTADGLNRYDGSSVKVYRHDPDDPNSLGHNIVRAMIADQSGDLWIGTWGGGLNQYDPEKDAFIRYQNESDNLHSLSNNTVRTVYEDRAGTIWVGTMAGLNKLDHEHRQFTRYQHDPADPNSLSNNSAHALYASRAGIVWVGTNGGGLNKFDRQTEKFTHYLHDPADPNSLSNDTVRAIYEDRLGLIWVGTRGNGLIKFDPATESTSNYRHDARQSPQPESCFCCLHL